MRTNFYDAVVCGSDLAGLVTATLLGRRGLRVLLVGHDQAPQVIQAGPYQIPATPAALPPPDAEPVARVFTELNLVPVMRQRAPASQPALQLVTPRHRVDLGASDEAFRDEVRREWPHEADDIDRLLARIGAIDGALGPALGADLTLPPQGFWERREVAQFEARVRAAAQKPGARGRTTTDDVLLALPPSHPLRAGMTALAALTGGFPPGDAGPTALARSVQRARQGFHMLAGGDAELRALFLDRITAVSGETRARMTAVEVLTRRGRVHAVRLRPRDEVVGLEHLVWAGPVSALAPLCEEKSARRLRELAMGLRPACYRYCLCVLVRPEALPEGMGRRVVSIADPARPTIEENALLITVAPLRDGEPVALWVECLVPAGVVGSELSYLSIVRSRVRAHLRRLMPFSDPHILTVVSPHDGLRAELPGAGEAHETPQPVFPMPALWSCDLPRALDVGVLPHATGIKNLVLASAENLPGLGLEGDFLSALGVARLAAGPGRKRKPWLGRATLLGDA
jgi:hypothetical protein